MTRLFRRQTRDWCIAALNLIEEQLAAGQTASTVSTQGSVSFDSVEDALFKVDQLNMRIDEIDRAAGLDVPDTNQVIVKAMWGRRAWR